MSPTTAWSESKPDCSKQIHTIERIAISAVASATTPRSGALRLSIELAVNYHRSVLLTRRAALNTLLAGGVGTAIGGGAYGLAYSRHQLQLVRASLRVAG